jgi:hypothetical protein
VELVAAALVVVAVAALAIWLSGRVKAAADHAGRDAASSRRLQILAMFGPAIGQTAADPRAFVTWAPVASTTRTLFPDECAEIDRAFGGRFPFSDDDIERAHGRWTADWLAWERTHDGVYKLKAAEARAALTAVTARSALSGSTDEGQASCALARARVDDVERDKLDLYQRRYEEYVRIAKALQTLRSR